jgi:hypothetical protein
MPESRDEHLRREELQSWIGNLRIAGFTEQAR